MTKREVLNAIVNGEVNAEVMEWAAAEIEKLDARNAKAAERREAKKAENAPLKAAILGVLGDEPKTATIIKEEIAGEFEVSTQKVSAMLRQLVGEGGVEKTDVKIQGKGVQKGYTRV